MKDNFKLDNEYAYINNKPIRVKEDMIRNKKIELTPMSDEWKEICARRSWWYHNYEDIEELPDNQMKELRRLFDLKEQLLSYAGETVCLPNIDPQIDILLSRGQLWYGDIIKLKKMKTSRCHENSFNIWDKDKENSKIVTGYALSKDSMWRSHSWIITKYNNGNIKIIETTEPRELYFGVILTEKESYKFKELI